MKLALAFSSKDRVDLTRQSFNRLCESDNNKFAVYWLDGSTEANAVRQFENESAAADRSFANVTGGPDRAIVFALSQMLANQSYTHVGLLENDVLLDADWLEPTLALFDNAEGLPVGAVSARSYADRILIQRDGYAVMHNVGAGHVIFTREAAQIVLANYRTGWWPENRAVFAQLSGLDIGKWSGFHYNEQMITADWSWDTILAAHGLATVALTPSKAAMIGQDVPLHEQGLTLTQGPIAARVDEEAFKRFQDRIASVRDGDFVLPTVDHFLRTRNGCMLFSHHTDHFATAIGSRWSTRWSQGFGPFTYVAQNDVSFGMPIFGGCAFHVSGGKVVLHDEATGYRTEFDGAASLGSVTLTVPRDLQYGTIRLDFAPGACLHGVETLRPQPWRPTPFDYSTLPPVEEKT